MVLCGVLGRFDQTQQGVQGMRSPGRKRPMQRKQATASADCLNRIAQRARYIGSPEHKTYPFGGRAPRPRPDASLCEKAFAGREHEVSEWLRRAIREGRIGEPWDGDFPRYVWHRAEGVCYEARLVNAGLGEYKGWPLDEAECPDGV